jgi:hypothetical protein
MLCGIIECDRKICSFIQAAFYKEKQQHGGHTNSAVKFRLKCDMLIFKARDVSLGMQRTEVITGLGNVSSAVCKVNSHKGFGFELHKSKIENKFKDFKSCEEDLSLFTAPLTFYVGKAAVEFQMEFIQL